MTYPRVYQGKRPCRYPIFNSLSLGNRKVSAQRALPSLTHLGSWETLPPSHPGDSPSLSPGLHCQTLLGSVYSGTGTDSVRWYTQGCTGGVYTRWCIPPYTQVVYMQVLLPYPGGVYAGTPPIPGCTIGYPSHTRVYNRVSLPYPRVYMPTPCTHGCICPPLYPRVYVPSMIHGCMYPAWSTGVYTRLCLSGVYTGLCLSGV